MEIILTNINKVFNKNQRNERIILKDFNLKIKGPGLYLLTGESGRGKTTLLNIISGYEKVDSGVVSYNELTTKKNNSSFSYLFQKANLIEKYTVRENLMLYSKIKRIDFNYELAGELLNKLSVEEQLNKKVVELSGGEKSRISLIKTIMMNKEVILVDEPENGLDEVSLQMIVKEIIELSKTKIVIVATHNKNMFSNASYVNVNMEDDIVLTHNYIPITEVKEIINKENTLTILPIKKDKIKRVFEINTIFLIKILTVLFLTVLFLAMFYRKYDANLIQNKFLIDNIGNQNNFITLDYDDKEYVLSKTSVKDIDLTNMYTKRISGGLDLNNYYNVKEDNIQLFIDLNENILDEFKVTGKIPENDDEILITMKDFYLFKEFGFLTEDEEILDVSNIEDILNKELYDTYAYLENGDFNRKVPFKIVGVIDTKIEYEIIDKTYINKTKNNNLQYDYDLSISNSIHSAVFLNSGYNTRQDYYSNPYRLSLNMTKNINAKNLEIFLNDMNNEEIYIYNLYSRLNIAYFHSEHQIYYEFFKPIIYILFILLITTELLFINLNMKKELSNIGILLTMEYSENKIIKDLSLSKLKNYLIYGLIAISINIIFVLSYNKYYSYYFNANINYYGLDLLRVIFLSVIILLVIVIISIYYKIRLLKINVLDLIRSR